MSRCGDAFATGHVNIVVILPLIFSASIRLHLQSSFMITILRLTRSSFGIDCLKRLRCVHNRSYLRDELCLQMESQVFSAL